MKARKKGSVILLAVFAIALLSTLVVGILQMNTEEIQLMQNQVNAAKSVAIAEAGINDAFAELRQDSSWTAGFAGKSFSGGSDSVAVSNTLPNLTVESTATSGQGFVSRVAADITVGTTSPYVIRVDNLRINE
jgi:type II secretory pathway component PulK